MLLASKLNHENPKAFNELNRKICDFYDAWIVGEVGPSNLLRGVLQDQNQVYYIVEGLYHHLRAANTRRRISNIIRETLPKYVESLRGTFPPKDLRKQLTQLLRKDTELLGLVRSKGKANDFNQLLKVVEP